MRIAFSFLLILSIGCMSDQERAKRITTLEATTHLRELLIRDLGDSLGRLSIATHVDSAKIKAVMTELTAARETQVIEQRDLDRLRR